MNSCIKIVFFALCLLLFLAPATNAWAQRKSKTKKQIQKEQGKKGPDGFIKGAVPLGNEERQHLLSRQEAATQAKQNGFTTGAAAPLPELKYEAGGERLKVDKNYVNKNAQLKKKKKSTRKIDKDNPNGKLYQKSVKKRDRKLF